MPHNSAGAENKSVHSDASGPAGVVSILEVYTIQELKVRLRWTDSALRAAKRRGLRLLQCGKRRYASGKEVVRFLESLSPIP